MIIIIIIITPLYNTKLNIFQTKLENNEQSY